MVQLLPYQATPINFHQDGGLLDLLGMTPQAKDRKRAKETLAALGPALEGLIGTEGASAVSASPISQVGPMLQTGIGGLINQTDQESEQAFASNESQLLRDFQSGENVLDRGHQLTMQDDNQDFLRRMEEFIQGAVGARHAATLGTQRAEGEANRGLTERMHSSDTDTTKELHYSDLGSRNVQAENDRRLLEEQGGLDRMMRIFEQLLQNQGYMNVERFRAEQGGQSPLVNLESIRSLQRVYRDDFDAMLPGLSTEERLAAEEMFLTDPRAAYQVVKSKVPIIPGQLPPGDLSRDMQAWMDPTQFSQPGEQMVTDPAQLQEMYNPTGTLEGPQLEQLQRLIQRLEEERAQMQAAIERANLRPPGYGGRIIP